MNPQFFERLFLINIIMLNRIEIPRSSKQDVRPGTSLLQVFQEVVVYLPRLLELSHYDLERIRTCWSLSLPQSLGFFI
jgi:hypothetical protein